MSSDTRRRLDHVWYRMQRIKSTSLTDHVDTKQEVRLHTVFDLSLAGLGTIFPMSVFVLSGHTAKDVAGPSSVLSLLFAALASGLAGMTLRLRYR